MGVGREGGREDGVRSKEEGEEREGKEKKGRGN